MRSRNASVRSRWKIRRLRQAALLHHVGRLAYDDATIEVHPKVVETTIEQLGFSPEVRTILTESQEHWNGDGPRGLRALSASPAVRESWPSRIATINLTHPPSGTRPHSEAMALLRREPGERFDPLMFEILDELAEQLEATGSDLTRSTTGSSAEASGHSRLVDAERDLQTLYSIERAVALPIGLRERFTLIAGLLRTLVPFERLRIEAEDHDEFRYGDRGSGASERILVTASSERTGRSPGDLDQRTRTVGSCKEGAAGPRRRVAGRDDRGPRRVRHGEAEMTDPATGLPNARYLRRILSLRIPDAGQAGPGFGLIALHVWSPRRVDRASRQGLRRPVPPGAGPAPGRGLRRARDAGAARARSIHRPDRRKPRRRTRIPLARTGRTSRKRMPRTGSGVDGRDEAVRLDAAHAAHPLDGQTPRRSCCARSKPG